MVFGFMAWLTRSTVPEGLSGTSYWGFVAYLVGGAGVAVMFLIGGAMSVPRRRAVHLPQWLMQDQVGAAFALISIIGAVCPAWTLPRSLRCRGESMRGHAANGCRCASHCFGGQCRLMARHGRPHGFHHGGRATTLASNLGVTACDLSVRLARGPPVFLLRGLVGEDSAFTQSG